VIKVIFADIDGTLRKNVNEDSRKLKSVLKSLKNNNIKVIITTGRNYLHAKKYSLDIGAYPIVISNNGALIKRYDNEEEIFKSSMYLPVLRKFYNYVKTYNCSITSNLIKENIVIRKREDFKNCTLSLSLASYDYEFMDNLASVIKEYYPSLGISNASRALYEKKKINNKKYFYDITNNLVDKGSAVKRVIEYLGVSLNEVMVMGDSYNDISMMLNGTFTVAPNTACNLLKNKVKYVLNEEIDVFLERVCDKNEEETSS